MIIQGFVAAIVFAVIGHLLHRRGSYWIGHLFIGLAFLAIAGTSVGSWLHHGSSVLLNGVVNAVISAFQSHG